MSVPKMEPCPICDRKVRRYEFWGGRPHWHIACNHCCLFFLGGPFSMCLSRLVKQWNDRAAKSKPAKRAKP
jgi:hypothetical protein